MMINCEKMARRVQLFGVFSFLQRTLEVLLTPDIGALYLLHEVIRAEATVLQVPHSER